MFNVLIIIFLPLISSLCVAQFAWLIGRRGSAYISTFIMFITAFLSFILFCGMAFHRLLIFTTLGSWIYSDSLEVNWGFYFDNLAVTMLMVVTIISFLVHLYSLDYMSQDPHLPRFMSYLSLFTFFMLVLVTGDNFVVLFLGWEGVGLCSYLLISFWYTRIQANKAAIKALVVNRIADLALTVSMVTIFFVFRSLDFHVIFPLIPFFVSASIEILGYEILILDWICILLFIGAMGKSAQIGLHTWLPDAMEGPTPVSALIHAATMVTAGVFLIIKCSPLFEYVPNVLSYIAFIGAITAFFSSTIGLVQNDIKKVIAYSTCSQLGYMIFACGLSSYHVSLFHLANHAFFKALLFLSAGALIHSLSNEQDMRKFGALLTLLPFTYVMFLIGSLSLAGFPFLTGFYSKDVILEWGLTRYTFNGSFAYTLGLISTFFTAFYSCRLLYLSFFTENNSFRQVINHVHELPLKMAFALSVLSLGSIFLGYLAKDLFIGLGTDFWQGSIFILPDNNNQLEAEFMGLADLAFDVDELGTLNLESSFNSTHALKRFKILPFFFSFLAVWLMRSFLTHRIFVAPTKIQIYGTSYLHPPYLMIFTGTVPTVTIKYIFQHFLFKRFFPSSGWDNPNPIRLVQINWINLLRDKSSSFAKRFSKSWKIQILPEVDNSESLFSEANYAAKLYYKKLMAKVNHQVVHEFDPRFFKLVPDLKFVYQTVYKFLVGKWYFDYIYNEILNRPLLKIAYNVTFSLFDKGLLEMFGPFGISFVLFNFSFEFKRLQSGRVYYYAYLMIMFLFVFIILASFYL